MVKAFLFDMDGVLINDEAIWEEKKKAMYTQMLGADLQKKMGGTTGIHMEEIYDRAARLGAKVSKDTFLGEFYRLATDVYGTSPIPEGTTELAEVLLEMDYKIGIVSASPLSWITTLTKRLPFENEIELIISLHEEADLKHKPHPDGYIQAMRALGAEPKDTIILEDSNTGIASAKASGAYTIGLRQNLVDGYQQEGADDYADTMFDVIELVKSKV